MSLSTLEAYDLIRFAEAFEARLVTAHDMIADRDGLEPEKEWMTTALKLVRTALVPAPALLERAKDLPELEEAREEFSYVQQNLWVDALEKLHAGITFCASSRAPVIEALFPHLKFPQLRRASRDAIQEFGAGYERRLKSSYVSRILARDDFSFVRPVLDQVATAYATWQACFAPVQLPHEQAAPLRAELIALGKKLDVALRQARCLAEASLAPIPDAFENSGLAAKPRKRAARGLPFIDAAEAGAPEAEVSEAEATDVAPLEPDSVEPSAAELAELAALSGAAPAEPDALDAPPVSEAPPAPEAAASPEPQPAPEPTPAPPAAEPAKAPSKRGRKKNEPKPTSEPA